MNEVWRREMRQMESGWGFYLPDRIPRLPWSVATSRSRRGTVQVPGATI